MEVVNLNSINRVIHMVGRAETRNRTKFHQYYQLYQFRGELNKYGRGERAMNNHEYHQRYMEAMKKLAGNPEHKDRSTQWEGGEDNCDPDIATEDPALDE